MIEIPCLKEAKSEPGRTGNLCCLSPPGGWFFHAGVRSEQHQHIDGDQPHPLHQRMSPKQRSKPSYLQLIYRQQETVWRLRSVCNLIKGYKSVFVCVVFQPVTSARPACLSFCCSSGSQLDSGLEHHCSAGGATQAGNQQHTPDL